MTTPQQTAAAQQLDAFAAVDLDANGQGTAYLQPPSFQAWTVTSININTSQGPTETPVPRCVVYRGDVGGQVVAQTWMGNGSTAVGTLYVQPSQRLAVRWTGGVPGSRATVWLDGTFTLR